ncbi:MAG: L,D-transpeptidase [Gaiellales bacterium]
MGDRAGWRLTGTAWSGRRGRWTSISPAGGWCWSTGVRRSRSSRRASAPPIHTPTGRFFVTDLVVTGDPGGPFGWFALGLSGHQPNLPAGWGGGDQLAIHGTNRPSTIGGAASAGCVFMSPPRPVGAAGASAARLAGADSRVGSGGVGARSDH